MVFWFWFVLEEPELLFMPDELLLEELGGLLELVLPEVPRELLELLLVEPLVPNPLEAELVVSLPFDGVPDELLLELLPMSELPGEDDDVPPEADCPHCCCAACVLGPMTPSTLPGSQPCDFSCCWSCRTESLPPLLPDDDEAPCEEDDDWSEED